MTRVLLTGFEPFGGLSVNPSQQLIEALDGEVETALLPVAYARTAGALRDAVLAAEPDIVICFGQWGGRPGISVERFALNLDDAGRVDNDGKSSAESIDPEGPTAYRSTLPVDGILAALHAKGIPATASRDAGGFLCNHAFYVLMRLLDQERPQARGGFVHIPLLPEQALDKLVPSLPLETLVQAARVIVSVCAPPRSSH